MRVTDVEAEVGALKRRAVADTLKLEPFLEALGDALDHVGDQGPCQAVQGAILAAFGRPADGDHALGLLDLHARRDLLRKLAERPVDHDAAGQKRHVHAAGQFDGLSTDSTHLATR